MTLLYVDFYGDLSSLRSSEGNHVEIFLALFLDVVSGFWHTLHISIHSEHTISKGNGLCSRFITPFIYSSCVCVSVCVFVSHNE